MAEPDLHTRLRSAIEARLALAERTKGGWSGVWRWEEGFGDMCNDPTCEYGSLMDEDDSGVLVLMSVHGYDIHRDWQGAGHIAANSPDFVIRACRADLARLERHVGIFDNVAERLGIGLPPEHAFVCTADGESWPCPEVRVMAEVWLEI